MKKQSDWDLLNEIGHRLTQALTTLEMASRMRLNISPDPIASHLLEIKNLVNKLKSHMIEERRVPIAD